MKKTMMLAAMLVLVGCGEKKADDAGRRHRRHGARRRRHRHGHGMTHDSAMAPSDSTMARDTTKK